ncbi:hypothetical protein Tco_0637480 [Tanacetum coccineum]
MITSKILTVIRIILVILPEHQSDTKSIHNDDGNPSRANIKQALWKPHKDQSDGGEVPVPDELKSMPHAHS